MTITENLETILGARYGRDVRQAIHDGIKQAYDDAIKNGNANMEVSQARGTHPNLRSRLDETDAQLAQTIQDKADKTDVYDKKSVNTIADGKRDKSVPIPLADLAQDAREAMTGGSVAVVGTDVVDTINIKDEAVKLSKIGFAHEDVTLTTQDIKISVDTNNVMSVTLIDNNAETNNILYRYGKDGQYKGLLALSSDTVKYVLNNWENLVWDLTDNTIKTLSDNTIRPEKSILLLQNSNGAALNGVLAQLYNYKKHRRIEFSSREVVLTTQDMSFTYDGSEVMTITLTDNSSYKNMLWIYDRDGSFLGTHALNQNVVTFTLNKLQSLILDLMDNKIKVIDDGTVFPERAILLAKNSVGNLNNGVFARFYASKQGDMVEYTAFVNSIDLDDKDSFYYCQNDTNIYFKWAGNIRIGTRYKLITKTFDDLSNDLESYYKQDSPEWVKNCCRLEKGFFIAYDCVQDKFILNSFSNQTRGNLVMLAENRNGYFGGELSNIVTGQAISYTRLNTNHIKPYYMETINRKEDEVIILQNENTFTFGYATDMHVGEWENGIVNQTYNVMEKVAKDLNVDAIFNGGDSIQYGRNELYHGLGALKHNMNKLSMKGKLYHVIGNHDYNGSSPGSELNPTGKQRRTWTITPYQTYAIMGKHHEHNVVWGSKEQMYYYKDFDDRKIRVIFLNTSDNPWWWSNDSDGKEDYLTIDPLVVIGIRQQQAEWLANTALNFSDKTDKDEWHTMIVCHAPLATIQEGMDWNTKFENPNAIRAIINGFINGTSGTAQYTDNTYTGAFTINVPYDFTSQGTSTLIGVFSGHNHLDRLVTIDGFKNISTTAGYPDHTLTNIDTDMVRTPMKYSEFALDVVIVDKGQRKVSLKRFGAGTDREFTY